MLKIFRHLPLQADVVGPRSDRGLPKKWTYSVVGTSTSPKWEISFINIIFLRINEFRLNKGHDVFTSISLLFISNNHQGTPGITFVLPPQAALGVHSIISVAI